MLLCFSHILKSAIKPKTIGRQALKCLAASSQKHPGALNAKLPNPESQCHKAQPPEPFLLYPLYRTRLETDTCGTLIVPRLPKFEMQIQYWGGYLYVHGLRTCNLSLCVCPSPSPALSPPLSRSLCVWSPGHLNELNDRVSLEIYKSQDAATGSDLRPSLPTFPRQPPNLNSGCFPAATCQKIVLRNQNCSP